MKPKIAGEEGHERNAFNNKLINIKWLINKDATPVPGLKVGGNITSLNPNLPR